MTNVDSDVCNIEEEQKSKEEEEKPLDWAEEATKEATKKLAEEEEEDFPKVMEGWRREVVATKKWQEFKPRRVRAVKACVGRNETELSFEPGDIVTEVRPARGNPGWLEGTLEGRVGLVWGSDVEYLP